MPETKAVETFAAPKKSITDIAKEYVPSPGDRARGPSLKGAWDLLATKYRHTGCLSNNGVIYLIYPVLVLWTKVVYYRYKNT